MCGVFGCAAARGRTLGVDEASAASLRDMLAHRGPDGAGQWRGEGVILAHRRLAVLDLSAAGAQPMSTADGRFTLVYNGELYNDAQVRAELARQGRAPADGWRSRCDTETVLHALAAWGFDALARLRGMYALGLWDARTRHLLLARDPLGVKPMYFWADEREIVFASEIPPILGHPRVPVQPSLAMVSAYLTTIRTTLANNTLFEGVLALRPGEAAACDLSGKSLQVELREHSDIDAPADDDLTDADAAQRVRDALEESVQLHLRADAPMCALLSGGIDSTAIAAVALNRLERLRTYAAGSAEEAEEAEEADDLRFASLAADALGTEHASVPITRDMFRENWPALVQRMGLPLSTPNEVAIHAIAKALRADGCVVALSGEGADELLAGYEAPMDSAWRFERELAGRSLAASARAELGGRFQLESSAWTPPAAKPAILRDGLFDAVERDEPLIALYTAEFARCLQGSEGSEPLDAHLRFHQRVNLTGLLQRLDTATMLASVEGRTPFADAEMARVCAAIPMTGKYCPPDLEDGAGVPFLGGAGVSPAHRAAVASAPRTKLALRRAFAGAIPEAILERPKASFPLPFQTWIADMAGALRTSTFAREIFAPAALEAVARDAGQHWRLAWPMINIALWGERWWGR